jgi:hypothetical protein
LGFLGEAYKAAKFTMDRLRWSKYWATMVRGATTEIDLWRFMILLTMIVDGRFRSSEIQNGGHKELLMIFTPTFDDMINRRIDKWRDKRNKTLFGMTVPDPSFLV